jgi:WD40 repeat protein
VKRWVKLIIIILGIGNLRVTAQENGTTYNPIYDVHFVNRDAVQWAYDSQSLVFRVLNDDDSTFTYYQYYVETGELEQNPDQLPFTVSLTEEEQEHFHARFPEAYIDPQGETIVYVSDFEIYTQGDPNLRALFAMGDRSLGLYTLMDTLPVSDFVVRWNDNGGVAVIEKHSPYGPATIIYYVRPGHGFYYTLELEIAHLANNMTIFDISSDGNQILLPIGGQRDLHLWHVPTTVPLDYRYYDPTNDRQLIAENNVAGAAFIPDDTENILILNTQGIVQYNLSTQETLILNDNINSGWAQWAAFSPDNAYIAVVNDCVLYVLPVEDASD